MVRNSTALNPDRTILIVEDNPGDVRLIREALRGLEPVAHLEACGDADQALAYIRKTVETRAPLPRLILLDFNLPKSGSRGLLETLKEDRLLRLIPVAVLTTSDAERDIRDAYALRANCYLRKPVDLDSFFNTIRTTANFWLNVASTPAGSTFDDLR